MKLRKMTSILLISLLFSACDNSETKPSATTPNDDNTQCNHEWGPWEVLEPATCNEKGVKERQCKKCKKTDSASIEIDAVYGHRFVDKEEKLPTYSYKGYKAHIECEYCKKWYDTNGNEVDKALFQLDEAGDDLAISLNGVEKATFTKNTIPNNFGGLDVNWTANNIELKVNDVVTITKPGDVNTKYAFEGDSTLAKDIVVTEGKYDITMTSSPDGFLLTFDKITVVHVHNYAERVTTPAGCETKGEKTLTCTCGNTKKEEIPALGHDYQLYEKILPTYTSDGYISHYKCKRCSACFDLNKNKVDASSVVLDKAGDNIAVSLNGEEKGSFTLVSKENDTVAWKYEGLNIALDDVISINLPNNVSIMYGFFADNNFDENKKSLVSGTFDVNLVSTPNGMNLSLEAHQTVEKALVVKVNGTRYLLNKVNYYNSNVETYIYGYHCFKTDDVLIIEDEINDKIYNYDDLADDTTWNTFDFRRGTNGEIIFKKSGKFGIEFSRNGDEKISITKVFNPTEEGDFDVVFKDGRPNQMMLSSTFDIDSNEYKEIAWYINHEKVINNQEMKDAISNGITFYSTQQLELDVGTEFKIANINENGEAIFYITCDRLVSADCSENAISLDLDFIKINKKSTYLIMYFPAFGSIYIVEVKTSTIINSVYAMVSKSGTSTSTQCNISDDNKVTIPSTHYDKNQYVVFYAITQSGQVYLDYELDSSISYTIARIMPSPKINGQSMKMIYLNQEGLYEITLDLNTNIVTMTYQEENQQVIGNEGIDPTHNLIINFSYNAGGTIKTIRMVPTADGTTYSCDFEATVGNYFLGVSVMDLTANISESYTTYADNLDTNYFTNVSSTVIVIKQGTIHVDFNLNTCIIGAYAQTL